MGVGLLEGVGLWGGILRGGTLGDWTCRGGELLRAVGQLGWGARGDGTLRGGGRLGGVGYLRVGGRLGVEHLGGGDV